MSKLRSVLFFALCSVGTAAAASFQVTTTADSGAGSLREAITNANGAAGADTISFSIPASDPNCDPTSHVCTIAVGTSLPAITDAVTIDGYTQPGASANTQSVGSNAVLLIQVSDGLFGVNSSGFVLQSANSVLRGLVINLFGDSVLISGPSATGNTVEGCFIGTSPDGLTAPLGNNVGVLIIGGAKSNLIGGSALSARNLISGHTAQFSIMIRDSGTDNNQVLNNLIGTTRTGNAAIPNGGGVLIFSGAKANHVGISAVETPTPTPTRHNTKQAASSAAAVGNLISGNNYNIRIADSTTTGNVVEGNLIGTNADGTAALVDTTVAGIDLFSSPSGNIIGGTQTGSRNVISGNGTGITIAGANNSVLGNYIGTDVTGNVAVPNRSGGVEVLGGSGNIIGGLGGAGNVISGNLGIGLTLNGNFGVTNDNQVIANSIGIGVNGGALPNGLQGIFLGNSYTSNNTIGGAGAGEGNSIANNGAAGISLGSLGSIIGNAILGNSIHDNVGLGIEGAPATYPVLTSVSSSSSRTEIMGTLSAMSNTAYRIEFFANTICDDSGFGEGQIFIGSIDVTTDGSGTALIDFVAPVGNLGGESISATATDPANTTSGFSACFMAPATGATVLANISTRLRVETGDNVLIGGFIITGTASKKVIVRAIGPSLPLAGSLADPQLELHDATGQLISSNDNWQDAPNKQEIIDSGLAPTNDLESAILSPLSPGPYTTILKGTNAATGIALVEAYDLDPTVASKLGNISTRGLVQTDDNVMIGGFIATGIDPLPVLVRAIGPSLTLTGKLADATLELHDANGLLLDSNDNWRSDQESEIVATGLAPTNDLESAILMTLPPAAYTAILRGVNGTTGVALVEGYALQ